MIFKVWANFESMLVAGLSGDFHELRSQVSLLASGWSAGLWFGFQKGQQGLLATGGLGVGHFLLQDPQGSQTKEEAHEPKSPSLKERLQ